MESHSDAPPLTEHLRSATLGVMHVQRRHLEQCAERHGLSGQQAMSLFKLGETGDVPMRELAERIGCDPSYLTGVADRLEELGLLERRPDAEDRRVKLLVMTPRGRALRQQLIDDVNASAPGFSVLSEPEQELLLELLQKVLGSSGDEPCDGPTPGR